MGGRRTWVLGCLLVLVLAACTGQGPSSTPAQDPTAEAEGVGVEAIPEIVREVGPSTVSVEVTAQTAGGPTQGTASGVIWNADGVIVTNNHVVAQAEQLTVGLASGERLEAEVLATDPPTDLAVVQVDGEDLPAAEFAPTLPEVGELVVALGNPLGFENTATAGIVSGLDRSLPAQQGGSTLTGLVQTDAAISSGNSGGALVNAEREVVGINVAAIGGQPQGGVAENVGFAIPSTTVVSVVEELLATGEVEHAYLGIRGASLTPQVADRFGLDRDRGVVVAQVQPDGPADEAGLRPEDVVVGLAGESVEGFGDLAGALQDLDPGDEVALTYVRDGQEQTTDIVLGELPDGGEAG